MPAKAEAIVAFKQLKPRQALRALQRLPLRLLAQELLQLGFRRRLPLGLYRPSLDDGRAKLAPGVRQNPLQHFCISFAGGELGL